MSEFKPLCQVGAVEEGRGGTFRLGDKLVALFLSGGVYYAIDDICPHMGASLGAGTLEETHRGELAVTCPWHAWRFNVRNGAWCDNPRLKIDAYEVRVTGDAIEVRPAPPPEKPAATPGAATPPAPLR